MQINLFSLSVVRPLRCVRCVDTDLFGSAGLDTPRSMRSLAVVLVLGLCLCASAQDNVVMTASGPVQGTVVPFA